MDLQQDLKRVLKESELGLYEASKAIASQSGEQIKTVHARWTRWLREPPETIAVLESDLRAIGYELQIRKIE